MHPKGLFVLSITEMWERFNFYVLVSLLVLYMTEVLHLTPSFSSFFYGIFIGSTYIIQVIGGYLSDRYIGNRKSIILGGILMALGQFIFAYSGSLYSTSLNIAEHSSFIFTFQESIFLIGAIVLCIGSSFCKVNINSMVGLLYDPTDKMLDSGYSLFYMAAHVGALSPFIINFVVGNGNPNLYQYGFLMAGCCITLGVIFFILTKDKYLRNPDGESIGVVPPFKNEKFAAKRHDSNKKFSKNEINHLILIAMAFIAGIIFYMCQSQMSTSILLFTKYYVNPVIPFTNFSISPEFYLALNPLFIILLTPLIIKIWDFCASKNHEIMPITKIGIGSIITGMAFLVILISLNTFDANLKINMVWIFLFNIVLVIGELFLSPICISLAYKLAPVNYTSLIMGIWLFSIGIGMMLGGTLASLMPVQGSINYLLGFIPIADLTSFFCIIVIVTFACGIIYLLIRNRLMNLMKDIS